MNTPKPESLVNEVQVATSLYMAGNVDSAKARLLAFIKRAPRDFEAFRVLGFIAGQQENFADAAKYLERAVELQPEFVEGWYYLGTSFVRLKMPAKAIKCFDAALQLFPHFFEALHDKGLALFDLRRLDEAIQCFDAACAVNPDSPEAWLNLAAAFREKGDFANAIECYQRGLRLSPQNLTALAQLGTAYTIHGRHSEAIEVFEKLLAEKPDAEYARGFLFNLRLYAADWANFYADKDLLSREIRAGKPCITPFIAAAMSESPEEQLLVAKQCAEEYARPAMRRPANKAGESGVIRLAYLSADFHAHATAVLMMDVIKQHDRNRFNVIGISFGPDQDSDMAETIRGAFDQFIDVRNKSDAEVAALIRDLDIDIAVDLKGYTLNSRPAILAYRPAPIQVNYLGYPGTMGVSHIDYVIADKYVIPESDEEFFTESVVLLPDSYQPNGKNRLAASHAPSREEAGLPVSGIVFCSFNSAYKNNPTTFDVWMDLLKAVDKSVLWLMSSSTVFEANIRSEAGKRGVDPQRIIFAKQVSFDEHMARIPLADIFLDSLPYGAHTTASDALWANVPVVTCVGNAFPGRVGQSVLQALEMPELITHSLSEYFALALHLATDGEALNAMRQKLSAKIQSAALFNAERYTAHLEWAYREMCKKNTAGMTPAKIIVPQSIG
jgi:protein O-GlcNAc transferase